jgi:hypothetical protein
MYVHCGMNVGMKVVTLHMYITYIPRYARKCPVIGRANRGTYICIGMKVHMYITYIPRYAQMSSYR